MVNYKERRVYEYDNIFVWYVIDSYLEIRGIQELIKGYFKRISLIMIQIWSIEY